MDDKPQRLVRMIIEENISSIPLISRKLSLNEDVIRNLLESLVKDGTLIGNLTDDGMRFYRGEMYVPKSTLEEFPEHTKFDSQPGRLALIWGIVILAVSSIGILLAPNNEIMSFFYLLTFFGVLLMIAGCYYFGTRKTIQ
ncbi:MAG: hypothetical protein RTU30_11925 [Candidatus Thorarchaeota archaeon]